MTEAEWRDCTDPELLIPVLLRRGRGCDRKFRLFAAACVRRVWPQLASAASRRAVEVSERYADGMAGDDDLLAAWAAAIDDLQEPPAARTAADVAALEGLRVRRGAESEVARAVAQWIAPTPRPGLGGPPAEQAAQAALLRDIFGNPFRPATVNPAWQTWDFGAVPAIARHIYDDRAFHELPVLADALADAGCDNEEVIAHCRGDGPHVRGCWVVDLILGKHEGHWNQ